jgi:hypothetical protein
MSIRKPAEVTCPTQKIEATGIKVKCYETNGDVACTLVINASGMEVYRANGHNPIRAVSWDGLVKLAESPAG